MPVTATDDGANEPRFFASDNTSGICPQALEYMQRANAADAASYGEDGWTARARTAMQELFETDCDVFFVFNGTAANSLALASMCQPYQSLICHELSHIGTDECAAPEFFSNGCKLLPVAGESGRLPPTAVAATAARRHDPHMPRTKAVSITQVTEVGTAYDPAQIQALAEVADQYDMWLHMDGARFANACASLDQSPADLSWRAGVDVLCFSGTKNGLAFGEAMVFFDKELARDFEFRRKQGGQLASKMRYLSAPWLGLLETGAWLDNARHANAMAQRLAAGVCRVPGVELIYEIQANTVFLNMPPALQAALRERQWQFHNFNADNIIRLACGWNTTPALVDALVADARDIMGAAETTPA